MLVALLLTVVCVAFYAFVAMAPKEVIRLALVGMWVLMASAIVISILVIR